MGSTGLGQETRVFIIDDYDKVRQQLVLRLRRESGIQVVGDAPLSEGVLAKVRELRPDVVVLESKSRGGGGIETCRQLAKGEPPLNVLVLTSYVDEEERQQAYMAGARAYLLKNVDATALLHYIAEAASGQRIA